MVSRWSQRFRSGDTYFEDISRFGKERYGKLRALVKASQELANKLGCSHPHFSNIYKSWDVGKFFVLDIA